MHCNIRYERPLVALFALDTLAPQAGSGLDATVVLWLTAKFNLSDSTE